MIEDNKLPRLIVVDTNIPLLDPDFAETYKDDIICFSQTVVDELDSKKNGFGTLPINSRLATKALGKMADQMTNEQFYYDVNGFKFKPLHANFPHIAKNDDKIIESAVQLKKDNPEYEVVLVSNDNNLRISCLMRYKETGVKSIRHCDEAQVNIKSYYDITTLKPTDEQMAKLYSGNLTTSEMKVDKIPNLPINIIYIDKYQDESIMTARTDKTGELIVTYSQKRYKKEKLPRGSKVQHSAGDINPINPEQIHLEQAILDTSIPVVACMGIAGSGKSLVAVATALKMLDNQYSRIELIRPYVSVGNTIGLLKGDLETKLAPLKASFDGVFQYCGADMELLEQDGRVGFQIPEFVRGVTWHSSIVLVDECQNLTPHEIKTIVSRVGEGSKIVLLGDVRQVDNAYMTENSNGLATAIANLTGKEWFTSIYLKTSERASFLTELDNLM